MALNRRLKGGSVDITRFQIDANGTARLQTNKGVLLMDEQDMSILAHGMIKIKRGYAELWTTCKPRKRLGFVARLVMNAPKNMQVDHINHDTLDNRRSNLRICTRSENRRNGRRHTTAKTSQFKGVTYLDPRKYKVDGFKHKCNKPWRGYTRVMGKRIWLGYFETEAEAAMAYNRFAAKEFREFACYNRFDVCPVLKRMQDACQPAHG